MFNLMLSAVLSNLYPPTRLNSSPLSSCHHLNVHGLGPTPSPSPPFPPPPTGAMSTVPEYRDTTPPSPPLTCPVPTIKPRQYISHAIQTSFVSTPPPPLPLAPIDFPPWVFYVVLTHRFQPRLACFRRFPLIYSVSLTLALDMA